MDCFKSRVCTQPLLRLLLGFGVLLVQERKISPKRKFSGRISRGHPGAIRADIPARNFGQGGQNPGKTSIFGADIHDPKARTSTTLRGFQKLRSEKLWAEFSFPTCWSAERVGSVACKVIVFAGGCCFVAACIMHKTSCPPW